MRDPQRIDRLLVRLGRIWKQTPDLRLGQIIANVTTDPFYVEDEDLIRRIEAQATIKTEVRMRLKRKRCRFPELHSGESASSGASCPDCEGQTLSSEG